MFVVVFNLNYTRWNILCKSRKWVRKNKLENEIINEKSKTMLLVTFNIDLLSQDIVCIEIYNGINKINLAHVIEISRV